LGESLNRYIPQPCSCSMSVNWQSSWMMRGEILD
jgi:hypothetical protein